MCPVRSRNLIRLAVGLGCLASAAGGPETQDFDAEKKAYEVKRDEVLRDLRTSYHKVLLPLEKKLAAQGNFSQAIRVRTEREAVAAKIGAQADYKKTPAGKLDKDTGIVTLAPSDAVTGGGVTLDAEGALDGWAAVGSTARWVLPAGMIPGGYLVRLMISCAPDSGGKVTFREGVHTLTRDVSPPSGSTNFVTHDFGPLRIRGNGSTILEISAADVKGSGLFRVKSVTLVPPGADSDPAPEETSAPAPTEQ